MKTSFLIILTLVIASGLTVFPFLPASDTPVIISDNTSGFVLADINSDNAPDIIAYVTNSPQTFNLKLLINQSGAFIDGSAGLPARPATASFIAPLFKLVDVNNDYLPDILLFNQHKQDDITVLINNGKGVFTETTNLPLPGYLTPDKPLISLETDVNQDGALETLKIVNKQLVINADAPISAIKSLSSLAVSGSSSGFFTAVALDEFGQVTDTLRAKQDDICYVELRGNVPAGYYWGAVKVTTADADIISIEESYDWWYNGIGLWWSTASADPTRGGAGNLDYYNHFHSPDNDTYKSEGSSWAAAWEDDANKSGYPPPGYGPAGSLVTGTVVSEARFYYSGYLGNHSKERPGIRLGLKIKNPNSVKFDIYSHDLYELNWSPEKFPPPDIAIVPITPRGNYQSVHTEGNNVWIQVSGPANAKVGDTVTISAYGKLIYATGRYDASLIRTESNGVTSTLITAVNAEGNEWGPVSASYPITHASNDKGTAAMQDIGHIPAHPLQSAELKYEIEAEAITLDAIINQLNEMLGRDDIPDEIKTHLQTGRDACLAMKTALAQNPLDYQLFLSQMPIAMENIALAARYGYLDIWYKLNMLITIRANVLDSTLTKEQSHMMVDILSDSMVSDTSWFSVLEALKLTNQALIRYAYGNLHLTMNQLKDVVNSLNNAGIPEMTGHIVLSL
ncbi:MAG TPA: VCBS repeat-containing protein [Planctomycetota bacterium]|nr:VCBS repeat-containing protein [Planctomycetota bacterium]